LFEVLGQITTIALPGWCFYVARKSKCSAKDAFYFALCALIPFWGGVWGTWKYAGTEGGLKKARDKGFQIFFVLLVPLLLFVGLRACFTNISADSYAIGGCESQIKRSLKDPDSYRFIKYTLTDENVLIKYKAKNSFDAYVTESAVCKR